MTLRRFISIAVLPLALLCGSCGRSGPEAGSDGRPVVFVSVLPHAFFAERIAGGRVAVEPLVGPGQEPHSFEPTAKQMVRLSNAAVYFRAGAPFEDALCRKLPAEDGPRIVDTRAGITLRPAPEHEKNGHDGHEEPEGETDPHVWLSPRLAKAQAATICEALCEADPAGEAEFRKNLAALSAELDKLDAEVRRSLAPLKGRTIYVFHPAFGYFAAEYGLTQRAVETGGKTPGLKHINELIAAARADGVRVIFVQPQFSARTAKTIAAEIGGAVVAIDPLARDYVTNLRHVAEEIKAALAGEE